MHVALHSDQIESRSIEDDFRYVYLCSAAHSGSTLIAFLLGAHPSVSTVGEYGANFAGRCSCGVPSLVQCPLWQKWASKACEAGFELPIGKLNINLEPRQSNGMIERLFYYQAPWGFVNRLRNLAYQIRSSSHRRASDAIQRSVQLARILCRMHATSVFLDTTKNPLQIRFLAQYLGSRLKVISLVRDGRGVLGSLMEKEKLSREQAVDAWLWSNRNLDRAVAHYLLPQNVFRIRLEDLARDSGQTCQALFGFLGVDEKSSLDWSDRSEFHIIGNSMRHHFSGEVRLDESWRSKLSKADLAYFYKRAGWLNRRYGYEE